MQNLALAAKADKEPANELQRVASLAELPRAAVHRDYGSTPCGAACQLKRVGEEVSDKLDYGQCVMAIERHIYGKWACANCQTLIRTPAPVQVIYKGIPTSGLLAQVLVANYRITCSSANRKPSLAALAMRFPAPRSPKRWGSAVCSCSRWWMPLKSAMLKTAVLHAYETPVAMLKPGDEKTHRAYLWACALGASTNLKAVVYNFGKRRC